MKKQAALARAEHLLTTDDAYTVYLKKGDYSGFVVIKGVEIKPVAKRVGRTYEPAFRYTFTARNEIHDRVLKLLFRIMTWDADEEI